MNLISSHDLSGHLPHTLSRTTFKENMRYGLILITKQSFIINLSPLGQVIPG
jgi:hypothetical protein